MRRLAVIGQPVAHSRSPAMHTAAFEALGFEGWSYGAIELSAEEFPDRVADLEAEGYVGVNVTIPHKRTALSIADYASAAASEIGAANMLSFSEGEIFAENTDAPGFLAALPQPAAGKRALVMGAGGAARAVVWALRSEGAEVSIWNRTPERAVQLAADLGGHAVSTEALRATGDERRATSFEIVVNATSVGMGAAGTPIRGDSGLKALPIDADDLSNSQVVVDLVYASGETDFARAATSRGAEVVDGLEVLVRQGAESFRIWTGVTPPLDAMRKAAKSS